MRGHDAELLLQYLTVPYLRVPLLLRFFADRSRMKSLLAPQLQAVLDAALFEPGTWQPPVEVELPEANAGFYKNGLLRLSQWQHPHLTYLIALGKMYTAADAADTAAAR